MYVLLSEKHKQCVHYIGLKCMLCFYCNMQLVQWPTLAATWISLQNTAA